MEIVNYIGYGSQNSRKSFKNDTENVFSIVQKKVEKIFLKSKEKASLPEIDFSGFLAFVGKNVKLFSLIIAGTVSLIALVILIVSGTAYFQSHTGPLVLEEEISAGESDFPVLNKSMELFALESFSAGDNSAAGESKDSEFEIAKLFAQPVTFTNYKVQSGDTISGISKKFGLSNISTLIAVNSIENAREVRVGQVLKVPSCDGLFYSVEKGNSIASIAAKFGVSATELLDVNEIESSELKVGQKLFIPGAVMDSKKLQEAMGELFKSPLLAKYRLTSRFGPRVDPISGVHRSHTGVDMACPTGTPIYACASGTVQISGFHPTYGNYVIIKHANGYQTLYAHMSKIQAPKKGSWVRQGEKIGLVGSTGYSTGPHLHLTVYKNSKLVDPFSIIK